MGPKRQLDPCYKIHSERIKDIFDKHPDHKVYRAEYEEEFLAYLESVARECDAYIVREKPKCRPKAEGGKVKMPPDVQARCEDLEKRYAELVKKSEKMASESVEKSKEYMDMALEAKEEMDALKSKHTSKECFQGEGICDVCGVKFPLGGGGAGDWHDETSHWKGKAHIGYTKIREK